MMNRPRSKSGLYVTTPKEVANISLVGIGALSKSVVFSTDQLRDIKKLYGFYDESDEFMAAGAYRNCVRHAETDGIRLLAWIAKFIPAGEDPMKTMIQMAIDSGFDVSPEDIAWVEDGF